MLSYITTSLTPVHAMLPSPTKENLLPKSFFVDGKSKILQIPTRRACLSSDAIEEVPDQRPNPAGFHASIWDHHDFSLSSSDPNPDTFAEERIKELKKEVKSMLSLATNDPFEELDLIEKLQRLGISYHFEAVINDSLQRIHHAATIFSNLEVDVCTHLYAVALRFRILRQAGYYVSPDVFNKFKNEQGEFQLNLASDVQCLLSLYQASHLGFNGEDTMNQAMVFARKHLEYIVPQLSSPLASEVQHALEIPLHKSGGRIEAKQYISTFQAIESQDHLLLEFAKLDFNRIQLVQRTELDEIKRWWENMNMKSKVPFMFRERIVESYAMITTTYFEPKYAYGRALMTKINMMLTVLDDGFDVYSDHEELSPLVEAFQRWDFEVLNNSPEHIKVIFQECVNFVDAVNVEMIRTGQFNVVQYLKQEMQDYVIGLMEEAKILFSGRMPTMEEWLPVSLVTMALNIFFICGVMGLGELATKEVYDWIASKPKIIRSSYLIVRLFDDIGTYKWEHKRGTTLSNVTCCMNDLGISESDAVEHIQKMISSAWKDMNQECMSPTPVPMPVLRIIISMAQIMELFYAAGHDGYSNTKGRTKDIVTLLFIDPIPI
ncbi:(-)-germacrene D synthase [Thalictrum thalictroides]|uniref:(-)-germacrene D synthase n=1 Tax=Thalictrum thalictroides TaxID=46969 RepID=A0A7J6W1A9_THATH|nr:(-)-germacrene D synthase [Thalictrum thalictroides]